MTALEGEAARQYIAARVPFGDAWRLAGPHHARERVAIVGALTGRKATQRDAGVSALQALLWSVAGVAGKGECIAERDKLMAAWLAGAL